MCFNTGSKPIAEIFACAGMGVQRTEVEEVLESVGYGDEMRGASIASLSGGWKMKLALGKSHTLGRCSCIIFKHE